MQLCTVTQSSKDSLGPATNFQLLKFFNCFHRVKVLLHVWCIRLCCPIRRVCPKFLWHYSELDRMYFVYPDPGSWFLPIPDPGSRIPDPKTAMKDRGEQKFVVIPFCWSHKFHKIELFYFIFPVPGKHKIRFQFPSSANTLLNIKHLFDNNQG